MPGVRVGRHARLRRVIVDRDVFIPRGAVIGYNDEEDRKRHTVTEKGVVVVTNDDEPHRTGHGSPWKRGRRRGRKQRGAIRRGLRLGRVRSTERLRSSVHPPGRRDRAAPLLIPLTLEVRS